MLPGDSLVDRIFEEGIKEAKAIIIVLSKSSVEKPWVREELNAAFIKRINNRSKLIPIVIDDCEIPESLKSTVWESISDLTSYDSSFERILASIFGANDKPAIGAPPEYTKSFVQNIGGLNNLDSLVFSLSCAECLDSGDNHVSPKRVAFKNDVQIVPEEELYDSLEILENHGYVKLNKTLGGIYLFQITTLGFDVYAKAMIPDYQDKITSVAFAIVNENLRSNVTIREHLKENPLIVNHILNLFENSDLIKQAKLLSGISQIVNVSPALKRALSD